MRGNKLFLGLGALVSVMLLSGCAITVGGASQTAVKADGGIWKSIDGSKNWVQKVAVPTVNGKTASIANVDVDRISFDPQDHKAVYLSTEKNGIIYSYDGGDSWRQFNQLNSGKVVQVAISPRDKCTLYAITGKVLNFSDDCGRTWSVSYTHSDDKVLLTDIVIDRSSSTIVYMSDSKGEILKSLNYGKTWTLLYAAKGSVADLVMDPADSQIIYAATAKDGLYMTTNGGKDWSSLNLGLKLYSQSQEYKKLIADPATTHGLILVSKFGILKSSDMGQTWQIVNLLSSDNAVNIYSVAVNPKNSQEIYYATKITLLKTSDGGNSWSSSKLPFSGLPNVMVIDPVEINTLYIGTLAVKK